MDFRTAEGVVVPALTAAQMLEVDRLAMEEYGLTILQMMENAGRNLAGNVMEMLGRAQGNVTVLAGSGGNGGGGICCALLRPPPAQPGLRRVTGAQQGAGDPHRGRSPPAAHLAGGRTGAGAG